MATKNTNKILNEIEQLFEKSPSQKDIKEAIACLTEIVDACQEVQP